MLISYKINGSEDSSILEHLDECGNDEFDFFEALIEFYCVVGQKGSNTISLQDLKDGNSALWNQKLKSVGLSDVDSKYSNWLPSYETYPMEYAAAFNSLKGLGSFIRSKKPEISDKISGSVTYFPMSCILDKGIEEDYNVISSSAQPLITVSEMFFDCNNWFLSSKEDCSKLISNRNASNTYRIQLGYLMGTNNSFREIIEVLYTLAQRFVEYVITTNVGVEVFKLLLEQASGVDKTGTAELFLSIMLTTPFEKNYSRHQCKEKDHDLLESSSKSVLSHDLKSVEDLRRAYFGKVANVKLVFDCEKKRFTFQTLQSLDFLHQMIFFGDKDAAILSLDVVNWWIYSSSPLAITQSARMMRYIFETNKGSLKDLITVEEIRKLSSWIFLIISHNKNNTEFLNDKQISSDSIPLLVEEEVEECIELFKYILLNCQHSVSAQELKSLTSIANDSKTFKCISSIIISQYKEELKKSKYLKDIIRISIINCCEKNRLDFVKLLVLESGGNNLEMLVEFFNETFNDLLDKNDNDVAFISVLISIEYLNDTVEALKDLGKKFNDKVYISFLQKFNFLSIFEKIFNSISKCYTFLHPALKLLLTLLQLNIPWFVNSENISKLQIYLEDIFISTKDRIVISYLSKIFMFLYKWTKNRFGSDSKELKDMINFLCLKPVKKLVEILMMNHQMLQIEPSKLKPEELFFYSLSQEHIFAAIKIEALPKIGTTFPRKIFEILIGIVDYLVKLTTPLGKKTISEIVAILPRYALHICVIENNDNNINTFLKISQLIEQLLSRSRMPIGKVITSYFDCVSKLCMRQSCIGTRNETIKVLVGEKILEKLSYILVNEIFGDTPFYFDLQSSITQAVYLNSPLDDKVNESSSEFLETDHFFENLSFTDENAISEICKKRLHTFKQRHKEPLVQNFKLESKEYSKFYFNHVLLRLSKVGLLSSHLMEEWEGKKELLSSLKTLFFLTSDKELKAIIKKSFEWVYAFVILCPWQKYEDLFDVVKGCFLFGESDINEELEFFDRVSLKIFSILESNKTLDDDTKSGFAYYALSRLALRK
uniref:Nucleolar pre-ribosomal-associated protein 1 C-terminal domain-containing protein n=1 Tax=Strongyloides stercoralis TaxID=6248 RepID=A0A0K0E2I9_STRER